MKKSELMDGRKMFVIKTEHFVTSEHFAKALTAHFYDSGKAVKLTKKDARNILSRSLFLHGIYSAYSQPDEMISRECLEQYNEIYAECSAWIKKNYPYLQDEKHT